MSLLRVSESAGHLPADVPARRVTLHRSDALLVEDFSTPADRPGRGHSDAFQVVLPYRGVFRWMVGRQAHLLDANTMLFVTAGEDYAEAHPLAHCGHASLILTPEIAVLDELCGGDPARASSAFATVVGRIDDRLRVDVQRLLWTNDAVPGRLRADELAIHLLARAVGRPKPAGGARPTLIARAKEVIHALGFEPLSLTGVARELGVSPVYLTQTFTRFEGVPLYRYQTRLRLNQALLELPFRRSLTELALDLGFSSHSHFAAVFRAAFGLTPSQYRLEAGARTVLQ